MSDMIDDDGLTDEERAASQIPDDEEKKMIFDPDAEPEEKPEEEPKPEPEAEEKPEAEAKPEAAPEAEPQPEAEPEAQPEPEAKPEVAVAPAPILTAVAPEDAKAKLDAIATDKDALLDKFEAGEITTKEYQKELDRLNDERSEIQQQIREADLARRLNEQQIQNQWVVDCNSFLASHAEYADQSGPRYKLLDESIRALASMPSNRGLSNVKALEKAHRMVEMELGAVNPEPKPEAQAAKPAPAKIPKPAPQPNIGALPAANMNDDTGGEFAALDRLQKGGDIQAYEAAVEKLTDAQRARYFKA